MPRLNTRPTQPPAWTWGVSALALAALAAGWGWAQWQAQDMLMQQWPAQWRGLGQAQPTVLRLTARVMAMPDHRPGGLGLRLAVLTVQPLPGDGPTETARGQPPGGQAWQGGMRWHRPDLPPRARVPESVGLFWPAPPAGQEPLPGEVWQWVVQLDVADGRANPGGPDLPLLAWERGERGQMRLAKGHAPPTRWQAATWRAPGWVERWRAHLRAGVLAHACPAGQAPATWGATCLSPGVAGLVRGLALGEQGAIQPADWDALRLTGTAHLAAISGLHVAMMGWLCARVLGWLWRRSPRAMARQPAPQVERVALVLGALGYALLSGWGVPAQRTVWMVGVVAALQATGHRWPWPLVCLLAAVGVVAWDPWALMSAGFWLSFVAVAVLMWSGDEPQLALSAQQGAWQSVREQARSLWRTQWVATVGLAPLSLVFFQATSLVGLVANLGAIPWFSLALTPLALLGLAFEPAWWLLQPLGQFTLDALAAVADHSVGWAWWVVPEVRGWAAALGLLGGAWCVAPVATRTRLLALPLCLPLLCPTSLSQRWPVPAQGEAEVWAADVGQGTAVLVRTARHALLFDTGPVRFGGNDAGRDTLDGLLRAVGVSGLDELQISHGDGDHVGGAVSLMRRWPVARLRASLAPDHALWSQADATGQVPAALPCVAGQHWQWDGVQFEVLHPAQAVASHDERPDNATSCVLAVRAQGRQVLLTGDIEADQEQALVDAMPPQALRSEVLLVAHHGSRTSSTEPFLQAVAPTWAVVQVGQRNRYGHPHPDVLQRLQAHGARVVTSPACGAWRWHSGNPQPPVCFKLLRQRYWHPGATDALPLTKATSHASPILHARGS
ncbi:DNA internalization-related competence protein ComEC/Rec2 [Aquabacterium lacunae]|uniref:DNA internalization-related competence protein ComEC/Rec2 n=1 Tax=Aquabacterium lacunae TaxID=2528630 RepID=A0A4Q9H4U5_9BURK|nr:DNA internalization-related competence protein ComEC/Rec2 [Aquabacterium lacunae]